MTLTLDLPPQVEKAYLAEAQVRGLPLAEVVREVLVAARPADPAAERSPRSGCVNSESGPKAMRDLVCRSSPMRILAGNPSMPTADYNR